MPVYEPIYSLILIKLKSLKTYIEINLASNYIKFSKSLANTSILFMQELNNSFLLYVNFQELNNLNIKNKYLMSLIGKFLN